MKKLINYLQEVYLKKGNWYISKENITGLPITNKPLKFIEETYDKLVFEDREGNKISIPTDKYYSFSEIVKEDINNDDVKRIKSIIRKEVAQMFFNLFKTRSIWGNLKWKIQNNY